MNGKTLKSIGRWCFKLCEWIAKGVDLLFLCPRKTLGIPRK
jgi:hypothetical protein